MRYYSEPFSTVKMVVIFLDSSAAKEFHAQLSARSDVYGLQNSGYKIVYWCLDRNLARQLAVDFERSWVAENKSHEVNR